MSGTIDTEIIDDEELEFDYEDAQDDDLEEDEDLDDLEETEDLDESEDLEEGTEAAATIKSANAPGETKAQMVSTFVQLLAQLGKDDLSKLHDQVQSQFGPNKAPGSVDNSGKNKASISGKASAAVGSGAAAPQPMPKLSVKEDIADLFSGDELNEDFKDKAEVIFEAALNTRINLELINLQENYEVLEEELHEEYEAKLEESTATILEDLTDKLDKYLDAVVEEWMEENQLAIESSLRTEIAESFIESLQGVFAQHYIDIPDDRLDLVAEMKTDLDNISEKYSETLDENIELKSKLQGFEVSKILTDVSEGLTAIQSDKLKQLAEGIEYTDSETFTTKMEIIKENFLTKKLHDTGIVSETIDGNFLTEDTVEIDEQMSKYLKAFKNNK